MKTILGLAVLLLNFSAFAGPLINTISKNMHEQFLYTCPLEEGGIASPCFKGNYFTILCASSAEQFSPLLNDLGRENKDCLSIKNSENSAALLDNFMAIAGADKKIITESDLRNINIALLENELTFQRWDENRDGKWDIAEVDKAYEQFSPLLDDSFKDARSLKKLKLKLYLYTVKNQHLPDLSKQNDLWKFMKYVMSYTPKKVEADRKTIAGLIKVITLGESR